ncbi:polysaccharide deacetylase family protein [Falsiroseomonas selenitidurans]|uniref:Chitooligosaccharide deacetylase n=1 Tax=Falsiroseomonas selenitidurans TaxID=2716335 RepID=A0ABX1DYQ5_9PROT|nr:polysaccharide deacetylase family protein [Falsiroseomonas selenitidurans]NKC29608.1 polysaccharide deacetylase family protein [Falsiroseomonas selenitidurans]
MSQPLWPKDARLALSVVVNVEEGGEMSIRDGDKGPEPVDELGVALKIPIRNFANESNYLYGIRAGWPRVAAQLAQHGVTATFTAAAVALERAPEIGRAIAAGGHEACSHGWRWVHQFSYDEARERDFVRKAVDSLRATTGERPVGWLSRYLHSPRLRTTLAEEGFLYHMDDFSDDVPRWDVVETKDGPRAIVIVPYALDSNDMKFWLAPGYTPQQWLDYAIETFEVLLEEGATAPRMMSLGVHLRIIGRPGRIGAFGRFLQHARSRPGVWFATRAKIARAFAASTPAPAEPAAR